ncbi:hypothetical protein [Tsukamurella pseudospumae]|uniref:Uncharacterized protein n=1 Tax=Tsukamurella pseudospumae TaxID=239498 RepID=A0A138AE86_9ACTN|nr:hypothetical protein [Tsukamurella pseudospumae]KXP08720.1 hypothetical protein AXK60_08580 [Tsukamurella pseudospumae]
MKARHREGDGYGDEPSNPSTRDYAVKSLQQAGAAPVTEAGDAAGRTISRSVTATQAVNR